MVRGGQEWEIDSRELVPGDVVLLEPGSRVPADLRLTVTTALQVDESLLTGESLAVAKQTGAVPAPTVLADRHDMAYSGSVVTTGRGRGVVVATGGATELGQIAGLIRGQEAARTPLQERMDHFARLVGIVVGVVCLVAFGSGVALGEQVGDMFLIAVALAVAAIPEGLPVAFTITLALGVNRMARRNAIVRRLPAVETLGSTTVIGSDKTGTLTQNRMTVTEVWAAGRHHVLVGEAVSGRFEVVPEDRGRDAPDTAVLARTLLAGVLTNEAEAYVTDEGLQVVGDPTETALLVAAMTVGIQPEETREDHRLVAEIPFESEARYSAAVCVGPDSGAHVMYVKGAPERVLAMCTRQHSRHGVVDLDVEQAQRVHASWPRRDCVCWPWPRPAWTGPSTIPPSSPSPTAWCSWASAACRTRPGTV